MITEQDFLNLGFHSVPVPRYASSRYCLTISRQASITVDTIASGWCIMLSVTGESTRVNVETVDELRTLIKVLTRTDQKPS